MTRKRIVIRIDVGADGCRRHRGGGSGRRTGLRRHADARSNFSVRVSHRPRTANGSTNGADIRFTRYSPLDQIDASNFNRLQVAWRFKTDNFGPYPEYKLEGTPIMVKGVLYTTAGTRRAVIALDAKTGELIWSHSLREGKRAVVSRRANCRDAACPTGPTAAATSASSM